jgi:hypothetical protein
MKALINDYKRRLKTAEEMLNQEHGHTDMQLIRVAAKASCYREFISELERLSEIELPSDDDVESFISSHPGNMGNLILDKAVDAGFRAGIKWLRDWIRNRREGR